MLYIYKGKIEYYKLLAIHQSIVCYRCPALLAAAALHTLQPQQKWIYEMDLLV